MVHRSEKAHGPYVDREGVPLNLSGGSVVLEGNRTWFGLGHNAVATFNGSDYLVYHAYDTKDNGRSKWQIEKITWINGWPYAGRRPML
jgi:arabinan endo-1,5-alpha-L-arabinosidase